MAFFSLISRAKLFWGAQARVLAAVTHVKLLPICVCAAVLSSRPPLKWRLLYHRQFTTRLTQWS
jgi:hypothetical protein